MKKNIIKYIILIIIINITDFLSGKSYCNYYNNINSNMYSRKRNHQSIMNNSLIIENKPMEIVKKKPIMNNNFKRIDRNHHIKKISLKKRIYNFFYKRKNYALINLFLKTKFIIMNHPMINLSEALFKKKYYKKALINNIINKYFFNKEL